MKKMLFFVLLAALLCAVPISAAAEGDVPDSVEAEVSVMEELPVVEETTAEGEISVTENTTEVEDLTDTATESVNDDEKSDVSVITDSIVAYVEENLDTISLIVTVILSIFYQIRKHASLNKSIGTLNNNAVTVAENSATCIHEAMREMTGAADTVAGYRDKTDELLEAYKQSAEDRKALETMLAECEKYLKNAKNANVELSNEVAELLVLANIPNSKKEELYARHRAAVGLIEAGETAEVTHDEGNEE